MTAAPERSVLLVGNFLSDRGRNRGVCEDLAAGLAASGWSVTVTSTRTSRPLRLLDMAVTACRRRRDYRVAQVDVYSGPAFCWAEAVCWALRRSGRPYVLSLHGGSLPEFARRWPGRVSRLLRSACAVTAPSGYLLHQMRPFRGDILDVPNPLDLAAYDRRPRPAPRPKLVWLRAFHEIYRPTLAVEVLARLRDEFPGVTLTMVGPDKGDGSLGRTRSLAAELGVEPRLKLTGGVPKADVPRWLRDNDVFLNTTTVDNTPVSVVEAMASGLGVVSTDVGGLPFLVDHGRNGLLVPPDDPAAMAEAVRRLLTEPGLSDRLTRAALEKAEAFEGAAVVRFWDRLLRSAADGGAAGGRGGPVYAGAGRAR